MNADIASLCRVPYWDLAVLGQAYLQDNNSLYKSLAAGSESQEQDGGSIDDLFLDRTKSAKSLIAEITKELEEREELRKKNLLGIDYDVLKAQNYLLELKTIGGYVNPTQVSRRRSSLEQQIFNLYRERRDQNSNSFRDKIWLTKDLLEALREYWGVQREDQFLTDVECGAGMY
ncbi:hypothetical protein KAR91_61240 [Candidatus Pacearchaeota archaeon]|nr:hypothetical protein [Candidatus Pacearchaeota archaeon]